MTGKYLLTTLCMGALLLSMSSCAKTSHEIESQMQRQPSGTAMVRETPEDTEELEISSEQDMKQCQNKMTQHLGRADARYDKRFIDAMISHHEGAIKMAKDATRKGQHPELRELAEDVMEDQQEEIDKLKSWRKNWYGS